MAGRLGGREREQHYLRNGLHILVKLEEGEQGLEDLHRKAVMGVEL